MSPGNDGCQCPTTKAPLALVDTADVMLMMVWADSMDEDPILPRRMTDMTDIEWEAVHPAVTALRGIHLTKRRTGGGGDRRLWRPVKSVSSQFALNTGSGFLFFLFFDDATRMPLQHCRLRNATVGMHGWFELV